MNALTALLSDLPPDSWKVGILLCGMWLVVSGDCAWRSRWPLHVLLLLMAVWTAITDDILQILGGLSLCHWLTSGLLAESDNDRSDKTPDWERWCFFQLLADILMICSLAMIRPLLSGTNVTAIRHSELWQMGVTREPALVWLAGFLLLGSLAVRLGQYPAVGWLKATVRTSVAGKLSLGILTPLTVMAWIQVFPLFAVSRDLRVLGIGLGLLSSLMLGFLLVATTKRERLPAYAASGICGLGLLASFISPDFGIDVALPLATVVLTGLAIRRALHDVRQATRNSVITKIILVMVGILVLRIAGPTLLLLNRSAIPEGELSSMASQALLLQGLFTVAFVLHLFGAVRQLREQTVTVESGAATDDCPEASTYIRLADTEFSLDTILDYGLAWPLWCFLLVVTYLAEYFSITIPRQVSQFVMPLTAGTLEDLDQPESSALHWEVVLGTVAVLLIALLAA